MAQLEVSGWFVITLRPGCKVTLVPRLQGRLKSGSMSRKEQTPLPPQVTALPLLYLSLI